MSESNTVTREECEAIAKSDLIMVAGSVARRLARAHLELLKEGARWRNPWTIEILDQKNNHWTDFCHDAPLTLIDVEERERALKTEHPGAKFRVVPWFNSSQRDELRYQVALLESQLAEARKDTERLKREALEARSAIRHAKQILQKRGGNLKECLSDFDVVLGYEPKSAGALRAKPEDVSPPDVGQLCPTKIHKDGACCPACDHMIGKCVHDEASEVGKGGRE